MAEKTGNDEHIKSHRVWVWFLSVVLITGVALGIAGCGPGGATERIPLKAIMTPIPQTPEMSSLLDGLRSIGCVIPDNITFAQTDTTLEEDTSVVAQYVEGGSNDTGTPVAILSEKNLEKEWEKFSKLNPNIYTKEEYLSTHRNLFRMHEVIHACTPAQSVESQEHLSDFLLENDHVRYVLSAKQNRSNQNLFLQSQDTQTEAATDETILFEEILVEGLTYLTLPSSGLFSDVGKAQEIQVMTEVCGQAALLFKNLVSVEDVPQIMEMKSQRKTGEIFQFLEKRFTQKVGNMLNTTVTPDHRSQYYFAKILAVFSESDTRASSISNAVYEQLSHYMYFSSFSNLQQEQQNTIVKTFTAIFQ